MAITATRSPVYRVSRVLTWLVYAFAIVAIVFLATAFFLELFNANESTPFVEWVDRATKRLMQPFRGIFPAVEGESGSVFDASLLFAMFMYGLLAMAMHALLDWIDRKMFAARSTEIARATAEAQAQAAAARASVPGSLPPTAAEVWQPPPRTAPPPGSASGPGVQGPPTDNP
ncbi:MAG TPA: YggT family protein [Actinomycetota bacterium]|nr:YggT family protein [Actinomycetota bacterium]